MQAGHRDRCRRVLRARVDRSGTSWAAAESARNKKCEEGASFHHDGVEVNNAERSSKMFSPTKIRNHNSHINRRNLIALFISLILTCHSQSTPVAQLAPRNLLTRWDVSSIPANGIFLTKN